MTIMHEKYICILKRNQHSRDVIPNDGVGEEILKWYVNGIGILLEGYLLFGREEKD
jgi:hypothetical protein